MTPGYVAVGPSGSDSSLSSSLVTADSYAVLRSITGGYSIFGDSTWWTGGILDFAYKIGNVKDTTTVDISHFERGSVIPMGKCNGAVVNNGGGSYTIPALAVSTTPGSEGAFQTQPYPAYPYSSGANSLQTPPGTGPTLTFGQEGWKVSAKKGTLVGVITSVDRSAGTITVKNGNGINSDWTTLTTNDYVFVPSSVMGQNDKFLPGPTTTFTRWGVTQQTITASTPKEAFYSLSQEWSFSFEGERFRGPVGLKDMLTQYASNEANAFVFGDGQSWNYTSTSGNAEIRTEVLGILKAASTLGKDNGIITINTTNLTAIAKYNMDQQGGRELAVFGGFNVQTSVSNFLRNPANGFLGNASINLEFKLSGGKVRGLDLDLEGFKVAQTVMSIGSAVEFNNPRQDSRLDQAVCFPITQELATIQNSSLTSGTRIDSVPFGWNVYYYIYRNMEGRRMGEGRMQEYEFGPTTFQAPQQMKACMGTMFVEYIAGNKLQSFSI